MRSLYGALLTMAALAIMPMALRVQPGPVTIYGDTHFHNAAGSGLTSRQSVAQPGSYELLRMPREAARPALIELRGVFTPSNDDDACGGLYMENISLEGEWFEGKVVHLRWLSGFEIKVSSLEPAFAGPWRTLENYSVSDSDLEELPSTVKMTKTADGVGLKFHLGPRQVRTRPRILIGPGVRGLDLFLSDVAKFSQPEPARLLSTEKFEEDRTTECDALVNPQYMIAGDRHVWNLASEGFDRNKPGDYGLLRMPKETDRPALVQARGSFDAVDNAPCGRRLANLSFSGGWLANKTMHVRPTEDGFLLKVSSTEPAFAGTWKALENFDTTSAGPEGLPDTIKITKSESGSAFKLHLGPKRLHQRPAIAVSQNPFSKLDISMLYVKRFDAPEPPSALLSETGGEALEARGAACEANMHDMGRSDTPASDAPRVPTPPGVVAAHHALTLTDP